MESTYGWGRRGRDRIARIGGAGGGGFLVKEYPCGTIEVIKDTKFDESIWVKIPGERGAKYYLVGNIYMPPRVEEYDKRYTEEVRRSSSSSCTEVKEARRSSTSGRF